MELVFENVFDPPYFDRLNQSQHFRDIVHMGNRLAHCHTCLAVAYLRTDTDDNCYRNDSHLICGVHLLSCLTNGVIVDSSGRLVGRPGRGQVASGSFRLWLCSPGS